MIVKSLSIFNLNFVSIGNLASDLDIFFSNLDLFAFTHVVIVDCCSVLEETCYLGGLFDFSGDRLVATLYFQFSDTDASSGVLSNFPESNDQIFTVFSNNVALVGASPYSLGLGYQSVEFMIKLWLFLVYFFQSWFLFKAIHRQISDSIVRMMKQVKPEIIFNFSPEFRHISNQLLVELVDRNVLFMVFFRYNNCYRVFLSVNSALDHLNKVRTDPIVLLSFSFLCQAVKLVLFFADASVLMGEPLDVVAVGSDPSFTPICDDVFIHSLVDFLSEIVRKFIPSLLILYFSEGIFLSAHL